MNASKIYDILEKKFPEAMCELHFKNNYELIVSVILSAQCTDKRVNMITPALFKKYPNVKALANANIDEVKEIIKPCGFFNNKAKNIVNMACDVVEKYNGQIPQSFEELTTLAGVGRKTANVVISTAFKQDAIAVDTHVFRVSNRLGLTSKTPLECEMLLQKTFKKENWSRLHHMLVLFGRYTCTAKNPKCQNCELKNYCNFKNNM